MPAIMLVRCGGTTAHGTCAVDCRWSDPHRRAGGWTGWRRVCSRSGHAVGVSPKRNPPCRTWRAD